MSVDVIDVPVARLRHSRVRARTISVTRLAKRDIEAGRREFPDEGVERPRTREDCPSPGSGPCPFVSCKHHLGLDVNPRTGSIKLNFPDREVWELTESCTLDVADRGGMTLEEVASALNITRERVRQIEGKAFAKLRTAFREAGFEPSDFVEFARVVLGVEGGAVDEVSVSGFDLHGAVSAETPL